MRTGNKLLVALGTIALTAVVAPSEADAQYKQQCDWLTQQSADQLKQFLKQNPDHACAEVAARLLVERVKPAAGGNTPAGSGGRY